MSRHAKDLTGQQFGRLTVIQMAETRTNGLINWECVCSCGNTVTVSRKNLITGATKSCGCLRRESTSKRRSSDLTGQRFGRLVVIRKTNVLKNTHVVWECLCDCGNTTYVTSNNLNLGRTRSCGCLQRDAVADANSLNLVGQKFGRLTVIKAMDERVNSNIVWECLCDCGEYSYVLGTNLIRGNTQSCGCLQREAVSKARIRDLTGKQFGDLTVIAPTSERYRRYVIWECLCTCGNKINAVGYALKNGTITSCGCKK